MNQLAGRVLPPWMPPENTAVAVTAGVAWDAVVVPQALGLAALSILDTESQGRPGPVIWDSNLDRPRLYFLVPPQTRAHFAAAGLRILSRGAYVVVPGPTSLIPPGPYWVAPPDPDDPDRLVDAAQLATAIRRALGAFWVEYRPALGADACELLVVDRQFARESCIICDSSAPPLVAAGYVYRSTVGENLGWPVVACPEHAPKETTS